MRPFIVPEDIVSRRFRSRTPPRWKAAILCFRDTAGSRVLLDEFRAEPVGSKVLWGMEDDRGEPFAHQVEVDGEPVGVIARCLWGGPQAAILVEELACLGVRTVIGVGACGSLQANIPWGAQVWAASALAGDGTSRHYGSRRARILKPHGNWSIPARGPDGLPLFPVRAATMDAVYRETPAAVAEWLARGADAVNMESGPFYAVARHRGLRALWIGHISDRLVGKWEPWDADRDALTRRDARLALALLRRPAESSA